jgi:4-hydroxythreonine-4-phosphate dehydrogenase
VFDPSEALKLPIAWLATEGPESWEMGVASAACGRAALAALKMGHELALAGAVDGLVTGPVSKEAFHLAGEQVEGQTQLEGPFATLHAVFFGEGFKLFAA